MSSNKESATERIARMKREKAEADKADQASQQTPTTELVGQLTNEKGGEPNFAEIARKLAERQAQEAHGENEGYVKMTIYIRQDIADSFNALLTKRGQQKEYANQAFADFIQKKARELGL